MGISNKKVVIIRGLNKLENISALKKFTAGKAKARELSMISKQMYLLLHAGVSLSDTLYVISSTEKNIQIRNALKQAYESVSSGEQLYVSFKKDKIFPDFFVYMIKFGEETGNLDIILNNLSLYYEKQEHIYNKVKGGMVYPVFVFAVSIVMVMIMVIWIIPGFAETLSGLGGELPVFTKIVILICEVIRKNFIWILGILLLICIAFRTYVKTENGKEKFDKLKLDIPLLGNMFQKSQISKFCRNMSTLINSGFNIIKSLELLAEISENAVFRKKIETSADCINKGASLTTAFLKAEIDDRIFLSLVKTGEEAGSIGTMLVKAADFYERDMEEFTEKYLKLLEPILIIILAVIIGSLIVSVMLPIFSIMDSL